MIIWSRAGIFALLIPGLLIFLLSRLVPPTVPSDPNSVHKAKELAAGLGFLAGAVIVWPLGRWLNRNPIDTPYDPNTGLENPGVPGGLHTMFFIPLEYWAILWLILGLARLL